MFTYYRCIDLFYLSFVILRYDIFYDIKNFLKKFCISPDYFQFISRRMALKNLEMEYNIIT